MPQPLSSKESSLFRQVVRFYETKQYKKGLKAAEQILRKNPNHADTQAMKALILNNQGQTEEAFALAKLALKNDMKSHVCWHVYGLLYRHANNFEEASKAYKFALKLEPESAQIQRDLAMLQIQMRDYQAYIQTRRAMLRARPAVRQNWTALAIAYHLAGDLKSAENFLKAYEETLKSPPPKTDAEHSEAGLYRNTIIAEMGDMQRALEHLDSIAKTNLDKTAVMEMRAQYLLQLDRNDEAEKTYRALLDRNNEYRAYYDGLERSLGVQRSDTKALKELYATFTEQHDRLDAARRIPLDFLSGEDFRTAAEGYIRRMLDRGVPSLFANIKTLYQDSSKKETIQDIVESYSSESKTNGVTEGQTNGTPSQRFEQSVHYFLAQHYNYHRSRNLGRAMEHIEKALEISPKSVDYHMTRARILKHYGDVKEASKMMNDARELDLRDRYINSKCAKYQLRNDNNEAALETMSKFTRNETIGGPFGDLQDMQCMWYIAEDGEANLRRGRLGLALKRFTTISDIFDIWQEDQFDFHSFSLRKGQIRAYVDMLRWEDRLREHPYFPRAALSAIKLYVMLHDRPQIASEVLSNGSVNGMTAEDKKKARKERQKAEEKKDAEKKGAKKPGTGGDGEPKKEDPDPNGDRLLQTKQPLQDALKFLSPLLEFSPKLVDAQNAGFEVFLRRKKYLLAAKCLIAASSIDPENPKLHEQTVRFRLALDSASEPLPPRIAQVINSTFTLLPPSTSPASFNDSFMSRHSQSDKHTFAGLRVRHILDPSNAQSRSESELIDVLELPNIELQDAIEGLTLLDEWKSDALIREKYIQVARERWPRATPFRES